MNILIVTGLSGAGKSRTVNALEDIGYYCMDNMPPALIPQFVELSVKAKEIENVAIVIDVRGKDFFGGLFDCFDKLKKSKIPYKVLFLDSSDEVLIKRFKETRRLHPLQQANGISIEEAIAAERRMLEPVLEAADYIIDTSDLSVAQERERILALFSGGTDNDFIITLISFGFKYGLPPESDLVLDTRCLANPFYVDELKDKTGLDRDVYDYVMAPRESVQFAEDYLSFLKRAIPLYISEGKRELVISIGCTGGKHRSITLTEFFAHSLSSLGYNTKAIHRDISKFI